MCVNHLVGRLQGGYGWGIARRWAWRRAHWIFHATDESKSEGDIYRGCRHTIQIRHGGERTVAFSDIFLVPRWYPIKGRREKEWLDIESGGMNAR